MSLMTRPSVCTDALVLRTWDCGETSVIASLLTRDHGYVKVIAKAARQPRSRLRALVEPGRVVNAEFGLDPGRELQYLRGGTVSLDPLGPGATLERSAFLLGALELVDRCRPREAARCGEPGGGASAGLFAVCEEFVRVLSSPACRQPDLVFFGLEWELLARHGLAPAIGVCAACGRALDEEAEPDTAARPRETTGEAPGGDGRGAVGFNVADGGVICPACAGHARGGADESLDRETWLTLQRLGRNGAGGGDGPPLPRVVRRRLGAVLHGFLGYHLPGYRLPAALDLLRARKD